MKMFCMQWERTFAVMQDPLWHTSDKMLVLCVAFGVTGIFICFLGLPLFGLFRCAISQFCAILIENEKNTRYQWYDSFRVLILLPLLLFCGCQGLRFKPTRVDPIQEREEMLAKQVNVMSLQMAAMLNDIAELKRKNGTNPPLIFTSSILVSDGGGSFQIPCDGFQGKTK